MSFRWCLIKFDAVTCVGHMSTRLATSSFTQRLSLCWRWSRCWPGPGSIKSVRPGRRSKVRSKCRQWKIDLWLNYFNFLLWHWRSGMQKWSGQGQGGIYRSYQWQQRTEQTEGSWEAQHSSLVSLWGIQTTLALCQAGCICMVKWHHKPVTRGPHGNETNIARTGTTLFPLSPDTGPAWDYCFLSLDGCQVDIMMVCTVLCKLQTTLMRSAITRVWSRLLRCLCARVELIRAGPRGHTCPGRTLNLDILSRESRVHHGKYTRAARACGAKKEWMSGVRV